MDLNANLLFFPIFKLSKDERVNLLRMYPDISDSFIGFGDCILEISGRITPSVQVLYFGFYSLKFYFNFGRVKIKPYLNFSRVKLQI